MKKLIKILFIIDIFISFRCLASTKSSAETVDPIDLKFKKCMANPDSNAEMTRCCNDAYDDWDKALNEVYQQILLKCKLFNRKKFINSQRVWLKFRDAEFEVIDDLYYHLSGSMWIPVRVNDRFNVIKRRVEELRNHLNYGTLAVKQSANR